MPTFSDEELAYAKELQSTLSAADIAEGLDKYLKELAVALKEKPMAEVIIPTPLPFGGSTDVGDVSKIAPTAQLLSSCWVLVTPAHTWQVVTVGATSIAHKCMIQAGKVLAGTALQVKKSRTTGKSEAGAEESVGQQYVPMPDSRRGHALALS